MDALENPIETRLLSGLPAVAVDTAEASKLVFDRRFQRLLRSFYPGLEIEPLRDAPAAAQLRLIFASNHLQADLLIPERLFLPLTALVDAKDWSEALRIRLINEVLASESPSCVALMKRLGLQLIGAERWVGVVDRGLALRLQLGQQPVSCVLLGFNADWLAYCAAKIGLDQLATLADGAPFFLSAAVNFDTRKLRWRSLHSLQIGDALLLTKPGKKRPDGEYAVRLVMGSAASGRVCRAAKWRDANRLHTGKLCYLVCPSSSRVDEGPRFNLPG